MRNPWLWTILLLGLGACNAQQSALHVFGAEARQVREMAILSVFVTHSSTAILFDVGVRLHQSRTSQFSPSTGWEVASLYHSISVARAGFALPGVVPVPAKGLRRKLKRVGALVVR